MSPLESDKVSGPVAELNKEEIIDLLKDEEIEEVEKPPKEEIKKEKDEEEEEIDLKDDLEEKPKEDELELVTPVRRKEILKAFPELFKKFPYLEKAYYRDQQYTELLPTLDDAREAVDKSKQLDRLEADLIDGNALPILQAVKQANPKAFDKLVDNYLVNLMQVDKDAYFHVAGNVVKNTIMAMVREAKNSENKTLNAAAQVLNQFVFGSSEFEPPSNLSSDSGKKSDAESKLQEDRENFIKERFTTAKDDLNFKLENTLKSTIVQHIDPKESMSAYVKRTAISEAYSKLESVIEEDSNFGKLLDRLWEKAFNDNFSRASLDRIKSTYLSKAKTLLPDIIRSVRREALGGSNTRSNSGEETPKRGPLPVGKSASTKSGKIREASEIPKGMSTLDFLNSED